MGALQAFHNGVVLRGARAAWDLESTEHDKSSGFEALRRFGRGSQFGEKAFAFGGVAESHAFRIHADVAYQADTFEPEFILEGNDALGVGGSPITELEALISRFGYLLDPLLERKIGKERLHTDGQFQESGWLKHSGCGRQRKEAATKHALYFNINVKKVSQ
jgi:hypothetical protein